MPTTIQPVILTPDLDRLQAFYSDLLGAVEVDRIPEQGPTFFLGLRIGDSALGLVSDAGVPIGVSQMPQRILLSIDVADVDLLLERVEAAGGRVLSPPNDMSWGQRVAHIHDPDANAVNLTHRSPPEGRPARRDARCGAGGRRSDRWSARRSPCSLSNR